MEQDTLAPLSPEDVAKIEGARSDVGCGRSCLASILLAAAGLLVWWEPKVLLLAAPVAGLLLLWIALSIYFARRKFRLDLQDGKKRVIVAPVLAKDVDVRASNVTVQNVGLKAERQHRENLRTPTRYLLQIQGARYYVDQETWTRAKVGDLAEVHLAPRSEILLGPIRLHGDAVETE
jgi:hypothetical protein